ncbi:2-polyprenyl-6-methoxyphenol hydroxylase-like FAD-dependent oxidoreductase [Amycolatopsis lexingtonensis]|uniref:2-polyprenyl-6-methoxyphenol hydroxylase-like FAD-dependent oxidoreductase n=1 Tax=Amycolatopsis lexingtonensis TaxID=218822 RepID=A0ABR9HRY0_9PSEU|nr:FAD-dependent monooxygenase [Amycolatopsis lexingtonensis]MBE1493686.1 2-polyprenyl-6-methoxyphenol hydroxylase-like FAD-dependent oxidoreductase [Amycolatopsis lexingtonensis]
MNRDVVISGGGPVGLMLACELRLAGVDVLVVERLPEPDLTIKAGSVNLTTAEAFYRRGLLPAMDENVRQNAARIEEFLKSRGGGGPKPAMPVGHFAGIMVASNGVDFEDPDFRDVGPASRVVVIQQQAVEAILAARALELGVEIRRGVELTGFEAGDDGVNVRLNDGETVRASWLVGCDGGRSPVRKLAGFEFPGTDPAVTGRQAMAELSGVDKLPGGWQHGTGGLYVHGPTPGRMLTVEFDGPPADREAPVTAQELEDSFRRVSGADVRVLKVHSATRFTDNARQASTYRLGRVLLAGDAAHVHSPFGGQGLNLGIGDAVNLGWKLAATVHGWAPEGLLDTYTTERHPIGEWVLEWTRAQVALMRSDVRTKALRQVVGDLLRTDDGATYLAKKLSGVLHRYPLDGEHDLTGRAAPDFAFADGTRLGEHLQDGKALLLDLAEDAGLRQAAAGWGDRVTVLTAKCDSEPVLTGVLLRPDGFIAWAAEDGGIAGLDAALRKWFGEPA